MMSKESKVQSDRVLYRKQKHLIKLLSGVSLVVVLVVGWYIATHDPNYIVEKAQAAIGNQNAVKKLALISFYVKQVHATDTKDWATIFTEEPQYIQNGMTEEQFAEHMEKVVSKQGVISVKTTANSYRIDGDKGYVDRNRIECTGDPCSGSNYHNYHAVITYDFVNGEWTVPITALPSDRAFQTASFLYQNLSPKDKEQFVTDFGWGTNNDDLIITNIAYYFDQNPAKLALQEQGNEKFKEQQNRPVYQPPVIVQQPTYPAYTPSVHCMSLNTGYTVTTNCF